ncbi:MAG: hypothetical protein LBQ48_00335 [Oscillospiraceae bacterium]|jgi:C4-dicarboxylate-specific signal transduction histidine kinase|nr:hypothetical protein [Oscillospiraceae bacterium]
MKLGIAYSGAKETGTERYELSDKVACANFECAEKFQKRMEGAIAQTYSVPNSTMVGTPSGYYVSTRVDYAPSLEAAYEILANVEFAKGAW